MQISITISNIGAAIAAFSRDLTPAIIGPIMSNLMPRITSRVKEKAPMKTGALGNSIYWRQTGAMEWEVYEGVAHGKWVREGTKPHPIFPVNKKALFWQGLEHPVSSVNHPGIVTPNPYHMEAVGEMAPDFEAVYGEMFLGISNMLRF